MSSDTIVAIATPPGRGGVGIVRISGPLSATIAKQIIGLCPAPRYAHYGNFTSHTQQLLDRGIALFFQAPHSFTGEDVLELHGHGGPVVLDMLVASAVAMGARLARPGEFSERAFLNDKLDLSQAEAIADLINAASQQAARQAMNSLSGEFSKQIRTLTDALIQLRVNVESAIDFPEEEIDFLTDGHIERSLEQVIAQLSVVLQKAQQGVLVREGMKVAIAGRPNAGKSSLLNALAQQDIAIVTDIPGTTRDVLSEHIHIDGMPLHISDTAGLRNTRDKVEQIGMDRAWQAFRQADRILLLIDSSDPQQLDIDKHWPEFVNDPEMRRKLTLAYNKIDLDSAQYQVAQHPQPDLSTVAISAHTGQGLAQLKAHLKQVMGYTANSEGSFSARRRHLDALQSAEKLLCLGLQQLRSHSAGELLAEDLRHAQQYLNQITGEFSSDDLLGKIFSSFCIGK
ncbi:MAG: tRNA uridine-5-carboxymethylaminomethyl(34) synthesis GTPase MnmE [Cellvibrionaceae bacterium]|nr:tRNA uridine-5-carboxymethylaminomethyl(34) synthesis GTPase MnmE [Cellvibrionaceae bacterium]